MGFKLKILAMLILLLSFCLYQILNKGPRLSFTCNSVYDPKYQKVIDKFKSNFINGEDIGAQLSIYYKNKNVINISAGKKSIEKDIQYDINTLQVVYSSGKALCNLVIAMLVDRGLISYEDKIAQYWPEFGVKNKQNVTIADLVQHKSGTIVVDKPITVNELRNLDELAKILANQSHHWNGKNETAYSSIIFGNYINEVVRRVDPKKRDINQFVEEEINKPFNTELYFKVDEETFENRVAKLYTFPITKMISYLFESIVIEPVKQMFGFDPNPYLRFLKIFRNSTSLIAQSFNAFDNNHARDWINTYEANSFLSPGTSLKTNAYSIAKTAALIANGGELDGVRLLSKDTIKKALEVQEPQFDRTIEINFTRTTGGWAIQSIPGSNGKSLEITGWQGLGGSVFFWNEERKIGYSFAMNALGSPVNSHGRARDLLASFYEIIENEQ